MTGNVTDTTSTIENKASALENKASAIENNASITKKEMTVEEKNRENSKKAVPVDITVQHLKERFNKEIDADYVSIPTNEKLVNQNNTKSQVSFPLILLFSTIDNIEFLKTIKTSLEEVPHEGIQVPVMYKQKRGNKVAVLCKTYANRHSIGALKHFCLDFKYFESKGVAKEDLNFDHLIDLDEIEKTILLEEKEIRNYRDTIEVTIDENIVDCSKYKEEIERLIQNSTDNQNLYNAINPEPTTSGTVGQKENIIITTDNHNHTPTVQPQVQEQVDLPEPQPMPQPESQPIPQPKSVPQPQLEPKSVGQVQSW